MVRIITIRTPNEFRQLVEVNGAVISLEDLVDLLEDRKAENEARYWWMRVMQKWDDRSYLNLTLQPAIP